MKRLESAKSSPKWVVSPDLAKSLWDLSLEMGRQLGLLIDRHGVVQCVVVGDSSEIFIPVLPRFPLTPRRLRGLRFIRTSLSSDLLDNDDISDLAILRLDSLSVITGNEVQLRTIMTIHLTPPQMLETDGTGSFIPYNRLINTNPYSSPEDYDFFIQALEDDIASKTKNLYTVERKKAAVLVGVFTKRGYMGEHMEELSELARSAGFDVLGIETQSRPSIHPKTVIGGGKLREVVISALIKGADTIIFDNILSPSQMKAVMDVAEIGVIDRTQLILDIFAQRATTSEGKIRVELAQLKYFMPYLVGSYDNLSRIVGGIGVKGAGETKLEIDKRRISERITFLAEKLKKIESNRVTQRNKRRKSEVPVLSIVGYTNAGKSTLLNTLTQSAVYADDRLFATLDTSSKRIRFPQEREVIINDTVGFIRDLPEDLVGSFKSTLEELEESDVLLHVVDASSMYTEEHIRSVRTILKELGLSDKPTIMIYNKIDMVSEQKLQILHAEQPNAIFISAKDKKTLNEMMERLNYLLFISGKML